MAECSYCNDSGIAYIDDNGYASEVPCPECSTYATESILALLWKGDNGGFDPDRPFDGQAHTDEGERGKTRVDLRFRDVADCIGIGFLHACGYSDMRAAASTWNDVYEALSADPDFDPRAVCQNALCEMERRMGIFPNLPTSTHQAREDAR